MFACKLKNKRNAIKTQCKFSDMILYFIGKDQPTLTFMEFGSSYLDIMFFHFQSSKSPCKRLLKISSSKMYVFPMSTWGSSLVLELMPKARDDGRMKAESIGCHIKCPAISPFYAQWRLGLASRFSEYGKS